MTSRLSRWLLIAIIAVAVPFWWLLIEAGQGSARPKPIHIAELRQLAAFLPGQHPTAVTYTLLATRLTPGDFFAAGIGLRRRALAIVAWSLPVPGKGPIMIDPGAPPAEASVGQFKHFDHARQSLLDAEARTADLILYTQGHTTGWVRAINHLGGKAGMNSAGSGPGGMPPVQPISFTTAQAVAPGVVVIPASSHAPGARLIFVQLADGREFLFAGNIAAFSENWTLLRARSRLAADWGPAQDRGETYAWLRTIRQLFAEAPNLKIVPGHDYTWLNKQRIAGTISEYPPRPAPPWRPQPHRLR